MRLASVTPRLATPDLGRAMRFYAETLGMETRVLWPEAKPTFCILEREGVRIAFNLSPSPASGIELYLDVKDVARWHESVKARVKIEWGPEVYSYGRREFGFRDPDGNLVILSEPTTDPVTCIVEE
ncbi:MAG TPA: VOC family protein [Planctomycetota bacterium]|nr:VOC family protein [Planctomycetota bacterium]